MREVKIHPVRKKKDRKAFIEFPWAVYKGDPLWVPPLVTEIEGQMDPDRSAFMHRGEAEFFIAKRGIVPVGRICMGEDPPTNEFRKAKECVFGFLEYFEDYEVFCALMEKAKAWARARGLDTLMGPFNLDYEDAYGVLISGRDRPPVMMCGHTPPYYQDFMERYGFVPSRAANLAFAIDFADTEALRKLSRIADKLRERGKITIRQVDFSNWQGEIDNVKNLLDKALAWADDNRIPWHRDALEAMVEPFRTIADPELILFAEVDGEVVGWFPGIPNLNEHFIKANGLRRPWNFVATLLRMRRQPESLTVKSVLVLPEHQKRGAAVLLFDEMAKRARAKGYKWADLSITSEDNPDTVDLCDRLGAVEYKRWQVYKLAV